MNKTEENDMSEVETIIRVKGITVSLLVVAAVAGCANLLGCQGKQPEPAQTTSESPKKISTQTMPVSEQKVVRVYQ